jgi:hypothetical protein
MSLRAGIPNHPHKAIRVRLTYHKVLKIAWGWVEWVQSGPWQCMLNDWFSGHTPLSVLPPAVGNTQKATNQFADPVWAGHFFDPSVWFESYCEHECVGCECEVPIIMLAWSHQYAPSQETWSEFLAAAGSGRGSPAGCLPHLRPTHELCLLFGCFQRLIFRSDFGKCPTDVFQIYVEISSSQLKGIITAKATEYQGRRGLSYPIWPGVSQSWQLIRITRGVVLFCFFPFCSIGVWTQGLTLARFPRQARYHLSHSAALFVMGIFKTGSHELFAWAGFKLPSSWSWIARITGVSHWHLAPGEILKQGESGSSKGEISRVGQAYFPKLCRYLQVPGHSWVPLVQYQVSHFRSLLGKGNIWAFPVS